MSVINADLRPFHWSTAQRGTAGAFHGNGRLLRVGDDMQPNLAATKKLLAARIFVGFNVGSRRRWSVDDVIRHVVKLRRRQGHAPDASFILQKGTYTSYKTGKTVVEDGAQIVLLNLAGTSMADWREEMVTLAKSLQEALKQEAVVLELQRSGVTTGTWVITED